MPIRRRGLTERDRAEWAQFAQAIKPLPGREMPLARPSPVLPASQPRETPLALPPTPAQPSTLSVGSHPGGLDSSTWNKFRSGKLVAQRTIDLHGRTAQRAYHALQQFLQTAHADRVRCVEVITGRGSGETGGVLRRELPLWLNLPTLRPLVLAASHPHAANPGSVRLLLRRVK
jgi:DNA-nicking Smr family endonuclease